MDSWKPANIYLLALISLMMAGCGGGGGNNTSAPPPTYSISGSVTLGGVGLPGTTVTLTGVSNATIATDNTDENGEYTFSGLPNGNYTVIPSISGFLCNPKISKQTISGDNVVVNFTTTAPTISLLVADDSGNLGIVNITDGTVQVIGNMRVNGNPVVMTDIALDPSGNLYGVSYNSLYSIDRSTAIATLIGPLNISNATSLGFDDFGVLYTADTYFYTVNVNTGAITTIGNGSYPYNSSGDIASLVNQLYLTSNNTGNPTTPDDLVKLDSTGKGTYVGNIGYPRVYGMATNDSVNLYGVSGTTLIKIDPNTGAGVFLFDFTGKGLTNGNGVVFN